jgi:hypothetical protein
LIATRKGPGRKNEQLDEKAGKKMDKERRERERRARRMEREDSILVGGESIPIFSPCSVFCFGFD